MRRTVHMPHHTQDRPTPGQQLLSYNLLYGFEGSAAALAGQERAHDDGGHRDGDGRDSDSGQERGQDDADRDHGADRSGVEAAQGPAGRVGAGAVVCWQVQAGA
ncbi:hypothetical protein GCM10017744_101340 [Streptomyces antimycoticus]